MNKLGDSGITEERLDDFDNVCQQISDTIGRPRAIIAERKIANFANASTEFLIDLDSLQTRVLPRE